jgi:hypothetical protein
MAAFRCSLAWKIVRGRSPGQDPDQRPRCADAPARRQDCACALGGASPGSLTYTANRYLSGPQSRWVEKGEQGTSIPTRPMRPRRASRDPSGRRQSANSAEVHTSHEPRKGQSMAELKHAEAEAR